MPGFVLATFVGRGGLALAALLALGLPEATPLEDAMSTLERPSVST